MLIKNLAGIRVLLFLFIFCTHFKYVIAISPIGKSLFDYLNLGRLGVLGFVLLSGFCMALGYSDKFTQFNKENICNYIKSRFIKFYPLYLITGIVAFFIIFLPKGLHWIYSFFFLYLTMLFPWVGKESGGNGAGWFLAVIFFCYLCTPLLLILLNRFKNIKSHIYFIIINFSILTLFSIILMLLNDMSNEFLYRFPPVRLFEYAIALDAGFLYVRYLKNKIHFKFLSNYFVKTAADLLFISGLLFCMYIIPNNLVYRHFVAMPFIIILFLYLCNDSKSLLTNVLSCKPILFLGGLSFECYLIHYLVIYYFKSDYEYCAFTIAGIVYIFLYFLLYTIICAFVYKLLLGNFITKILSENKT